MDSITKTIFGVVSTLLINFYTFSATAQSFFERSLTVIVPFEVGGPTDAIARRLEDAIELNFGMIKKKLYNEVLK